MAKATTKTTAAPKAAPKAAATTKPKAAPAPKVVETVAEVAEVEATEVAYAIGDRFAFVAYSPLPEGSEPLTPIFVADDILVVTEVKEDGAYLAAVEGDLTRADTVFPEEVRPLTEDEEAGVVAEVVEEVEEVVEEGEVEGEEAEGETETAEGEVVPSEEMDAVAGGEALESAKQLATVIEDSYFSMGEVLTEIYDQGYYRLAEKTEGVKYETGEFRAYLEIELDDVIGYKKAMDLIDIHRTFSPLDVTHSRLLEIGYTKARQIVQRLKEQPELLTEKFDEIIDFAVDNTREALDREIRVTYLGETVTETTSTTTETGDGTRMSTMKFKFFEDQGRTIEEVLTKQKEKLGADDLAAALHSIIVEWAQLSEGVEVPLPDAISAMEARYGVTVTTKAKKGLAAAPAATKPAAAAPAKAAPVKATPAKMAQAADRAETTSARRRAPAAAAKA